MTTPAQFFAMPNGAQSHVQVKAVADGTGTVNYYPLAIETPQQRAEWEAIQGAQAVSPERALQLDAMRTQVAKLAPDPALRAVLDAELRLQAGVTTIEPSATAGNGLPNSQAEETRRVLAAREMARALGYSDIVRHPAFDRQPPGVSGFARPAIGQTTLYGSVIPGYAVIANMGTIAEAIALAGDIANIERALQMELNERARVRKQVDNIEANKARIRRETAEAAAESPSGQLAALRAEFAAFKASVGGAAATAVTGTIGDRMAALAAQGITVEVETG